MYDGTVFGVQSFIDATGATHPVLRMGRVVGGLYRLSVDNYVLVDATGVIRYISTFDGFGGFNDAAVRGAVDQWLVKTAVDVASWSAVKALYTDP